MEPVELTCFAVALFFALAVLIKWKRRRDTIALRLSRGLRGYVDATDPVLLAGQEKTRSENLMPA